MDFILVSQSDIVEDQVPDILSLEVADPSDGLA
jgi:hypothetical protein